MNAPLVVIFATLFPLYSTNHRLPSGPVRISLGTLLAVGIVYSTMGPPPGWNFAVTVGIPDAVAAITAGVGKVPPLYCKLTTVAGDDTVALESLVTPLASLSESAIGAVYASEPTI